MNAMVLISSGEQVYTVILVTTHFLRCSEMQDQHC